MSSRPQGRAPNKNEYRILEVSLPIGTVRSRVRRFYALSTQVNSSEDPNSAERQRVHTSIG